MWSRKNAIVALALVSALTVRTSAAGQAAEKEVPLVFSGGHETDPKDHGRPVVLVAAGLGVTPEVFRKAFSGVTPSRNGPPTPEHARANKAALMKVLGPHGITNDRLDEVSGQYRYQPQKGGLWKNKPAKGHAVVANGQIKKIVVTEPGAGYSSLPTVKVEGFETVALKATVIFDKDLKKNGSIGSVEMAAEAGKATR